MSRNRKHRHYWPFTNPTKYNTREYTLALKRIVEQNDSSHWEKLTMARKLYQKGTKPPIMRYFCWKLEEKTAGVLGGLYLTGSQDGGNPTWPDLFSIKFGTKTIESPPPSCIWPSICSIYDASRLPKAEAFGNVFDHYMVTVLHDSKVIQSKKINKLRELRIHIVFTRRMMSKIEFSWENSTYLLGKIKFGFGMLNILPYNPA